MCDLQHITMKIHLSKVYTFEIKNRYVWDSKLKITNLIFSWDISREFRVSFPFIKYLRVSTEMLYKRVIVNVKTCNLFQWKPHHSKVDTFEIPFDNILIIKKNISMDMENIRLNCFNFKPMSITLNLNWINEIL